MNNKQRKENMQAMIGLLMGITLMLLAMLLSCCKSPVMVERERIDSIYVEKLIPYSLPADSGVIRALLDCNEEGTVVLQKLELANTRNVELQFALDDLGNLKTGMIVRRDTIYLPSTEKKVYVDKVVEKIVEVEKEPNWWMRLRIWLGNIALVASAGWIIWKLLKMKWMKVT